MAEYLLNLTNGQMDEKGFLRLFGTLLNQTGVVQSGALLVAAQGTPDMTVKVAGGTTGHDVVFITSAGDTYHGWNTANKNVTILANSSGVIKTDAIVAYADLSAGSATSNNPGALKFTAVRRAGSNTGNPTTGEIETAVSNNPYLLLSYVTVSNGASSINSGNITDQRVRAQLTEANFAAGTIPSTAIKSEAWTSYTPTWTASSVNPALVNGTIVGSYIKIGRTVHFRIHLQMGSSTTYGTGDWTFSLPVPPITLNAFERPCGSFSAENAGVKGYMGVSSIASSDAPAAYANKVVAKIHSITSNGESLNTGTAIPFTWGVGDKLSISGIYEAAS